ncbi:MAG: YidC/Oxa1 family membrane protein insertase [Clostridia bacterium]|nr:YidC/Oxa1 family membrane protein insertase [Clostridia bacterium]
MSGISGFLYNILAWINGIVGNYGVSIIIFTFLMRMVCMPFDYKSRKGMRKMALIQPKLNALQQKYGNDKQKLQQKQAELMRKEGYNPLSGCLPMLLTWPLMIAMFSAMRDIANEQLVLQAFRYIAGEADVIMADEKFLWVKNLWMTDSFFAPSLPDVNSLRVVPFAVWQRAFAAMQGNEQMFANFNQVCQNAGIVINAESFVSADTLNATLDLIASKNLLGTPQYVPGMENVSFILFSISVFQNFNGLLILPVLAGVTQVLQTKFMNAQQPQQPAANGANPNQGKFMKWFFPCLSVFFCLSSNAGFALYWVISSVVSSVQGIVINKILEKKDGEKKEENIIGKGSVK